MELNITFFSSCTLQGNVAHEDIFSKKAAHSTHLSLPVSSPEAGRLHQILGYFGRWPDNLINSVYFMMIVADVVTSIHPFVSWPHSPSVCLSLVWWRPGDHHLACTWLQCEARHLAWGDVPGQVSGHPPGQLLLLHSCGVFGQAPEPEVESVGEQEEKLGDERINNKKQQTEFEKHDGPSV